MSDLVKKVVPIGGSAKSELLLDFGFLGGGGSGITRGSVRPKFGYGARDENHFTHHDVFHINFFNMGCRGLQNRIFSWGSKASELTGYVMGAEPTPFY